MKPATKTAINLLPRDDLRKKPLTKFLKWTLVYGRYIIIFTEILTVSVLLVGYTLNIRNNNLKRENDSYIKELEEEKNVKTEEQIRNMQYRLSSMRDIHQTRKQYINFLSYLSNLLPEEVTLQDVTVSTGGIEITGVTTDESAFATLLHNLKEVPSGKITNLQIGSVTRGGKNPDEIVFSLSAQLGQSAFETQ